eukprot:scaffold14.g1180.t1
MGGWVSGSLANRAPPLPRPTQNKHDAPRANGGPLTKPEVAVAVADEAAAHEDEEGNSARIKAQRGDSAPTTAGEEVQPPAASPSPAAEVDEQLQQAPQQPAPAPPPDGAPGGEQATLAHAAGSGSRELRGARSLSSHHLPSSPSSELRAARSCRGVRHRRTESEVSGAGGQASPRGDVPRRAGSEGPSGPPSVQRSVSSSDWGSGGVQRSARSLTGRSERFGPTSNPADLVRELDRQRTRGRQLEAALEAAHTERRAANRESQRAKTAAHELEQLLFAAHERADALETKFNHSRTERAAAEQAAKELAAKLSRAASSSGQHEARVNGRLEAAQQMLNLLEAQKEVVERELAAEKDKASALAARVQKGEQAFIRLQQQLADAERDKRQLREALAALEARLARERERRRHAERDLRRAEVGVRGDARSLQSSLSFGTHCSSLQTSPDASPCRRHSPSMPEQLPCAWFGGADGSPDGSPQRGAAGVRGWPLQPRGGDEE